MKNSKLLLFAISGVIAISYYANAFAESEDIHEAVIPSAFAQEDHMVLDRQNYSDGDTVKMSGLIEGSGGHVLTTIIVHSSGKVMSSSHGYGPYDSIGMDTRIIPTSWEDGIYTIVASSVGKEFVEIFGVNYVLTESDTEQYQQEKNVTIRQAKNLLGNHVGVHADMSNYVQGGMLKIFGYGHSVDEGKASHDESVTLKIYAKNSQTIIHESKVSLDTYGEFSYYLGTSDDAKWDYTTLSAPPPFGIPRGFYDVVAEFAGSKDERQFYLKATTEQDKEVNAKTEQAKTSQQDAVHKITEEPRLVTNNNERPDAYLEWLEDSYLSTGTGVVRVTDPGMNLDPKAIDNFDVEVWSGSNPKNAISLTMTETDASTGIFQGTVTFALYDESSGHRLRVSDVDTIAAKHNDIISYSKISELASPLKQQKSGILAENVICKESFEKIFKSYEGAAACAKPLSVEKLVQRGWFR